MFYKTLPKLNTLTPKCPVICHFGELDESIPIIDVKKFKKIRTEVEVYIYLADLDKYSPICLLNQFFSNMIYI